MATYLQLHVLEGMTEDEVIEDGAEEHYAITDIKTPNIIIAEYNYGFAMFNFGTIPSCVSELKNLLHIQPKIGREYELVFALLNKGLGLKIFNIVVDSWVEGGQRLVKTNQLLEFMGSHMGKKIFLLEL